jgi:hypothetical protein
MSPSQRSRVTASPQLDMFEAQESDPAAKYFR